MKKPIGVFITDTHLSEKTIDVNKFIYKQADNLAKDLDVPIFHGGDYLQSRKSQSQAVLNTLEDIFVNLQSTLYGVIGNHDKTDTKVEASFVDIYKHIQYINIIDKGLLYSTDVADIYGISFYDEKTCFMDEFNKFLSENHINSKKKNILILHEAVEGVRNNDGSEVAHGIPKKILEDKFDLILVGHYHDCQELSDKIIYTGSAYQGNFGEDDRKGATIIYSDASFEYVDFKYPKYINYNVGSAVELEEILNNHKDDDNFHKVSGYIDFTEDAIYYRRKMKSLGIQDNILVRHEMGSDSVSDYESMSNEKIVRKFGVWCQEKSIEEKNIKSIHEKLTMV